MSSSYERKSNLEEVRTMQTIHINARIVALAFRQVRDLFKNFGIPFGELLRREGRIRCWLYYLFLAECRHEADDVTLDLLDSMRRVINDTLDAVDEQLADIDEELPLGFRRNVRSIRLESFCKILDARMRRHNVSILGAAEERELINETLEAVWVNYDSNFFARRQEFKDVFAEIRFGDLIADHMYYYPRHLGFLFHEKRFEGLCELCNSSRYISREQVLEMVQTSVSRSIDLNNKHGRTITLQQLVVVAATNKLMDLNAVYVLISMDPMAALFPKAKKASRVGGKKRRREHNCANNKNNNNNV